MEAVPFRGRDATDDGMRGVFGGDLAAEGDGEDEPVLGAFVVY